MQAHATEPRFEPAPPEHDFWSALVHRWFVQYNPVYLVSAALVLGGVWLVSRGLAREPLLGGLGVPAVAELYALMLIGGAALLTRIGQRRPAVMLALLAVLYQGDLTLHVETCAYLGTAGRVGTLAWLALFALKLYGLTLALELRPSLSALVVPTLGAIGLAALPHVFREVGPDTRTLLVELWVFGVGAAGVWTSRAVESAVGFDVRGRRALRATWILWAVLALAHVLYWSFEHGVRLGGLLVVLALLGVRFAERERTVWAVAVGTLAAVAVLAPHFLSTTALMAAAVLALRALRTVHVDAPSPSTASSPYRDSELSIVPPPSVRWARPEPATMQRLAIGAAWSAHLFAWTLGWSGGAWPEHRIAIDLALLVACALALWQWRRAFAATPITVTAAHVGIALGWLTIPTTALGWGLASTVGGFVLLAAALSASVWLARRAEIRPPLPDRR